MIVTIEKLISGGDGLGRIQGKVVFVANALPGEKHRIEIVEDKKGYCRGESLEILESTSQPYGRRTPFCPYYGICGGCNFQHLSYEDQLAAKKEIAIDHFQRLGGLSFQGDTIFDISVISSPEKGYRNRIQLHNREGLIGFNRRKSHSIVPIENCPLLVRGINNFIEDTSKDSKSFKERFTIFGTNDSSWIEGRDKTIRIPLMGKQFAFSPELFFQSNLALVPDLVKEVCRFAGEGEYFLDLYSGVGLFAAFLEDSFEGGAAVESARGALAFGRQNLNKTEYFEKTVESWARGKKNMKLDFAVTDPPRTGLSRDTVKILGNLKPARLAYVSCNPVTQARDIKRLGERGFFLKKLSLYDFYPQTSHMESLALFEYGG